MKNSRTKEVASIILEQIKATVPASYLMSWGARDWTPINSEDGPGLQFNVNGLLHKGFVEVILDEGKDAYIINLVSKKGDTVDTLENIYVMELCETLDRLIETGDFTKEEYSNKVKEWLNKN